MHDYRVWVRKVVEFVSHQGVTTRRQGPENKELVGRYGNGGTVRLPSSLDRDHAVSKRQYRGNAVHPGRGIRCVVIENCFRSRIQKRAVSARQKSYVLAAVTRDLPGSPD